MTLSALVARNNEAYGLGKLIFTTKVLDLARFESESFWKSEMAYTVETKQPVSPVFSLSFGMTVTIKFAMAATTKPITTTFFRPNLTKKWGKNAIFHCLRLVEIIYLLALIYTCVHVVQGYSWMLFC